MRKPKTWPSALIYLDATGPADGPTAVVERFDLIDILYGLDPSGKRFLRLSMQSTALTRLPPPKHLFIEVQSDLMEHQPACFAEPDVEWLQSAKDVFRLAPPVQQDGSEGRE